MKISHLYLAIAILGTLIPYYHFGTFLAENGLDIPAFLEQMFANSIAAFFSWDVIISTLAVFALVFTEGRKQKMKNLWIYVLFNLTVGVSLALPAFLYSREKLLEKKRQEFAN